MAIFNPLLGLLSLGTVSIPQIVANSNYVLAEVGGVRSPFVCRVCRVLLILRGRVTMEQLTRSLWLVV